MDKYIITKKIEDFAPPETQEKWDCSGWLVETVKTDVNKIMLCLTVTEDIVNQARQNNCDMIISHHPLFSVPVDWKDIDIYCAHTNMDRAQGGTTDRLIEAVFYEMHRCKEAKRQSPLQKIVIAKSDNDEAIRPIDYRKAGGQEGRKVSYLHDTTLLSIAQNHCRLGLPTQHETQLLNYFAVSKNADNNFLRYITCDIPINVFLLILKQISPNLRYVNNNGIQTLHKIAFCAGSGSEFIKEAHENGADAFVTGDVKFHTAVESTIVLFDIGHFESEILILDVFEKLIDNDIEIIRAKEKSPFVSNL